MSRLLRNVFLITLFLFFDLICAFAIDEITITTYYPSPYGVYRELRAQRIAIGDDYINGGTYCWEGVCTNTIDADADLVVAGNLGIGTMSPAGQLHVNNPNGYAHIVVSGNDPTNNAYSGIFFDDDLSTFPWKNSWTISHVKSNGVANQDALSFRYFNPSGTQNPYVEILPNGNVGIGTLRPKYKLDVLGDIRVTGSMFYGGNEGAVNGVAYVKPDYVFKDGYKLMTIKEVETYLEQYNHLPWMTSVDQEKNENGSEVNITRLGFETVETVENLQLQIITLNNLIQKQQAKLKAQQFDIDELKARLNKLEVKQIQVSK